MLLHAVENSETVTLKAVTDHVAAGFSHGREQLVVELVDAHLAVPGQVPGEFAAQSGDSFAKFVYPFGVIRKEFVIDEECVDSDTAGR